MKRNTKKAKRLSGEALQIAVKKREAKSKGEKERYTHLNAEFQRIARRDKKAVLSDQCKEIEENNRMGKTRDLFKKIRDTKGTFHAKMQSTRDRSGMEQGMNLAVWASLYLLCRAIPSGEGLSFWVRRHQALEDRELRAVQVPFLLVNLHHVM